MKPRPFPAMEFSDTFFEVDSMTVQDLLWTFHQRKVKSRGGCLPPYQGVVRASAQLPQCSSACAPQRPLCLAQCKPQSAGSSWRGVGALCQLWEIWTQWKQSVKTPAVSHMACDTRSWNLPTELQHCGRDGSVPSRRSRHCPACMVVEQLT